MLKSFRTQVFPQAGTLFCDLKCCAVQVLETTKAELQDIGVNVAALEAAAAVSGSAAASKSIARSGTVLLLKNLPYACAEDELHDLVSKFGGAARIVLPSTRALALIELPDKQVCVLAGDSCGSFCARGQAFERTLRFH